MREMALLAHSADTGASGWFQRLVKRSAASARPARSVGGVFTSSTATAGCFRCQVAVGGMARTASADWPRLGSRPRAFRRRVRITDDQNRLTGQKVRVVIRSGMADTGLRQDCADPHSPVCSLAHRRCCRSQVPAECSRRVFSPSVLAAAGVSGIRRHRVWTRYGLCKSGAVQRAGDDAEAETQSKSASRDPGSVPRVSGPLCGPQRLATVRTAGPTIRSLARF
jgi:hypothetical protein